MSANNIVKPIEKILNEDSLISNSTNISLSESLTQELPKIKNKYVIYKGLEPKILDILNYLQSDTNLANNKIQVLKYLESLFSNVIFNSEIFFRKSSAQKETLNLYRIIIYQYIFYTNSLNTKLEEDSYRSELKSLFILLLTQITFERETYHYLLSFIINFINEKNIANAINRQENSLNNKQISLQPVTKFKSEYLSRILQLLSDFYKYTQFNSITLNYFFFSGDSGTSITVPNTDNPKDQKNKLLNLEDILCVLLFIKVLPSESSEYKSRANNNSKFFFHLLDLKFCDKNKKDIKIRIDIDNNLTTNYSEEPLLPLQNNEINCVLIKFIKKKKGINVELNVGEKKRVVYLEEKNTKLKDEIKEIVLFENFIGICTNFMIYKEKKNSESFPKFLFASEDKSMKSSKEENNNNLKVKKKPKLSFPHGIYNEELYLFIMAELKDLSSQGLLLNLLKIPIEQKNILNDFKNFLNNNLIAMYMPTRVDECSNPNLLILRDSINNLDAEFYTKSPSLNGLHIYSRINDDFSKFGGINSLLPIFELMTNNSEFLSPNNFSSFFDLLANFVFSFEYQNALIKENKSNFFKCLSYFLEKIPDEYFDEQLCEYFKIIFYFFKTGNKNDFSTLNKQFTNYILMNEKILFKFKINEQKDIINQICGIIKANCFEINILQIFKILLYYDREKNNKFCCKKHAEYFTGSYPIMEGELSNRIRPLEQMIEILFEEKYLEHQQQLQEEKTSDNIILEKHASSKTLIKEEKNILGNNYKLLFYILSLDISPCLQKSIICLFTKMIEKYNYKIFMKIFDEKEELFEIVLFVYKTSIFDVKVDSLNLLLLIIQSNEGIRVEDEDDIQTCIKNGIIPPFLIEDVYNIKNVKSDFHNIHNVILEKRKRAWSEAYEENEDNKKTVEYGNEDKKDDKKSEGLINEKNSVDLSIDKKSEDINNDIKSEDLSISKKSEDINSDLKSEDKNNDKKCEDMNNVKKSEEINDNKKIEDINDDKKSEDINNDIKIKDVNNDNKSEDLINDSKKDDSCNDKKSEDLIIDKKIEDINKDIKDEEINKDKKSEDKNKELKQEDSNNDIKSEGINNDNKRDDINIDKKSEDINIDKKSEDINNDKKNGDINKDIKSEDINNDIKSEDINNDIKNENINNDKESEVLINDKKIEDISKDIKSENINKDIKNENINNERKSEDISNDKKSEDKNNDKKDEDLNDNIKNEDLKKEIKSGDLTIVQKNEIFNNVIKSETISNDNKSEDINSVIKNEDMTNDKKSEDLNNSIKNENLINDKNSVDLNSDKKSKDLNNDKNSDIKNQKEICEKEEKHIINIEKKKETNIDLNQNMKIEDFQNNNIIKDNLEQSGIDRINIIKRYGIKECTSIRGAKYDLYSPTDTEKQIIKKYNKKQYNILINALYKKVLDYFDDNVSINFKLDLLLEIVSKGDLVLIQTFLSKLSEIIINFKDYQENEKKSNLNSNINSNLKNIVNNLNLFHYLLDLLFQFYILKDNDNTISFTPGFPLNSLNESEVHENDQDKKKLYSRLYEKCIQIINNMLSYNMSKLDFVLSWSEYYQNLIEGNSIFDKINQFMYDFIQQLVTISNITTFSQNDYSENITFQNTLYYMNIYFEFFTIYKLKYGKTFNGKTKKQKIIQLSKDLKYILHKNWEQNMKLEPKDELKPFDQKIEIFGFIKTIFSFNSPIWNRIIKFSKVENEIYSKYICGNKNIFLDELRTLFYTFDRVFLLNTISYSNDGIPLIVILYHMFICFLNIGSTENEMESTFQELRFFFIMLLIGTTTLVSKEYSKNTTWPDLEQNKMVQRMSQAVLFNILFFFYNKIKDLQIQLKDYNSKQKSEENKDNENIESLLKLKRLYVKNFGYLLKILMKVYQGVEEELSHKSSIKSFFTNMFTTQSEGAKNSGGFLLMKKLYKANISDMYKSRRLGDNEIERNFTSSFGMIQDFKNDGKNQHFISEMKNISSVNYIDQFSHQSSYLKVMKSNKGTTLQKHKSISDKSVNQNSDTIESNEKKYLDNISHILFIKDDKEQSITLTDEIYNQLEEYIDLFLNDENIRAFFQKHYYESNKDLYPFIDIIERRQMNLEKVIPKFNNKKYLSIYPKKVCLVPYYYKENKYLNTLLGTIKAKNEFLSQEIRLDRKNYEYKKHLICHKYKNIKKHLFKFNGIWSYRDYFYNYEKYRLKYKLLNHMTNDFTKIFMTPISDIDDYLPKFSRFKDEIFRHNEKNIIPITKTVDLCFEQKEKEQQIIINNNENSKTESQSEIINDDNNQKELIYSLSTPIDAEKEKLPIYDYNKENFSFLTKIEEKDKGKEKDKDKSKKISYVNDFNEKDYQIFVRLIKRKHKKKNIQFILSDACLVKIDVHIRGIIYINDKGIGFYSYDTGRIGNEEDYDVDKKVCFGSVFTNKKKKYNYFHIKIPFTDIELVFQRRYFFKRNVLEIFSQNKKSYFFRIEDANFGNFFDALKKYLKDSEDITVEYTKNGEKIGLINKENLLYNYNNYYIFSNNKKFSSIKNIYLKWTKWEISTFTLMNFLNLFSSRTYNDINQYPVFPWIISDYSSMVLPQLITINNNSNIKRINSSANVNASNQNNSENPEYNTIIRPFNNPMGMLDITEEAKERKESYLDNWQNDAHEDDPDCDRYRSHYSTALYLTYYLVRVFPYSYVRIELQGKNFDDPNRLFNSIEKSFECALEQKSDLREIIPELFCLPELFYNLNNLNLGEVIDEETKKMKLVNEIEVPKWSKDAYYFVSKHRDILESPEVSETINEWINLIFGSKQKDKPAKLAGNLFLRQTYDDFDEEHKKACESEQIYQKRTVEFGVTPSQLFKNDTTKRISPHCFSKKPILYNYNTNKEQKKEEEELQITPSDIYLEDTPLKIFFAYKKNEDRKKEKILFLYKDKIKIISKTNEKGFMKGNNNLVYKNKAFSSKELYNKENKNKNNKEKEEIILEGKKKGENSFIINDDRDEINDNEDEIINEENLFKSDENIKNNETVSKYDNILVYPKYGSNIEEVPIIIYEIGNYIAFGGFWNGDIVINILKELDMKKDKSTKVIKVSTKEFSPIIHMKIDQSETFILCANKIGTIFLYTISNENKGKWLLMKKINEHFNEIKAMDLNENLNVFITCDKNGYNNLYTFPDCKLFNSYKFSDFYLDNESTTNNKEKQNFLNNIHADHVIISHCPLPCFVFYVKSKKSILVFSINFHFIKQINLGYEIVPNGIKKYTDYFNKDFIFLYTPVERKILVYDLINFDLVAKSSSFEFNKFIDFNFSKEKDHALILIKKNNCFDSKPESAKNKAEERNYNVLVLKSTGKGVNKLSETIF